MTAQRKPKILVAYASRHGTTEEIAQYIARVLSAASATVEVKHVDDVETVFGHDCVIVGSPIRLARWLPEATNFLRHHRLTLQTVPLALYTVCLTAAEDDKESYEKVEEYTAPLYEIVKPISSIAFGGVLNRVELSATEKLMLSVNLRNAAEGDFRNWASIESWATGILESLRV